MVLKTLIVDDEPIARKILREELEEIAEVEIVGEAENGLAGLEFIEAQHPDLVFLDLQMPVMGGFDLVRRLGPSSHLPIIIIVTAFDQYALQAFEAGAMDYLLKPVRQERLSQAIDRARRIITNPVEVAERLGRLQEMAEPGTDRRNRKVVGRSGEEYVLLNTDEVFAFQAEGDLVWIVTANLERKYLASHTLKTLQERLEKTSFRRVHRNALVNIDHIRKMYALSSQRWLIILSNNQEFIVSKRQAHSVRKLLTL
jgi:two-component system LytT family response regulator